MSNDTLAERIRNIRQSARLSQRAFADLIGASQGQVHTSEAGTSVPSADFVTKILVRHPRLDARWLLTGEGQMWITAQEEDDPEEISLGGELADDLSLNEMAELGSRGSLGPAWAAVEALTAAFPAFATAPELARLAQVDEKTLRAGLELLDRRQLLETGDGPMGRGWRLQNGSALIRSSDPININQHGLEALRELAQEIVPATEQGRGVLYAAILHLPGGGRELGRAMLESLRSRVAEHKGDSGPEAVSIIFGVAVKGERR